MAFQQLFDDLFKTDIPYADGYTSVFVLRNGNRFMLVDFAFCERDAEEYILPDLNTSGFVPEVLLCTHRHEDHDGGRERLSAAFPGAVLAAGRADRLLCGRTVRELSESELLLDRYCVLFLKGHTDDSVGLWDTKERILLSGDALQGKGIFSKDGKPYGLGLDDIGAYLQTIDKVRLLAPSAIVASHAYEPFGCVVRYNEVRDFLDICSDTAQRLIALAMRYAGDSPEELAVRSASDPTLMPTGVWTMKSVLNYLAKRECK